MLKNSILFIALLSAVADCQNHCAKTGHSGLIVNGQVSVPGKWPFVAALFNTTSQRFFCAGSLISWRHILTAAHCIQNKERVTPTSPGNVVAYLGRYNLNSIHERGVVSADPAYFIIHPRWKPFASEYEADITVVVLRNEVPRSDNVHPVCLWPSNIKPVETEVGTIVGWGATKNQRIGEYSSVLREINVRTVNVYNCIRHDGLGQLLSEGSFCAGGQGAGPCRGDSGGGFVMARDSNWFLKGIVSFGLLHSDSSCDVDSPAVFTDISHYTEWISTNTRISPPTLVRATTRAPPVIITNAPPAIITNPQPVRPPPVRPPPQFINTNDVRFSQRTCSQTARRFKRLIGGRISAPNKWTWVAALQTSWNQKFLGSGSLITQRHVLTAANLLKGKGDENALRPGDVVVHLGKFNIFEEERGAVTTYVRRVYIHPDWSTAASSSFDADLAMLELVDDVRLSSTISPICLWTSSMRPLGRDEGTVVGWGQTENKNVGEFSGVIREVTLRVYPVNECRKSGILRQIFSPRTLCVGGDGAGTCYGDGGGGFFTYHTSQWFLRGIASATQFARDGQCEVKYPAVFTEVSKFRDWIDNILYV